MRTRAMTRKNATPPDTDIIRTLLGMDWTWFANTCRSGSEMVIINPNKSPNGNIRESFLVFVMRAPTCFPMGSMACSDPMVKNTMPIISRIQP